MKLVGRSRTTLWVALFFAYLSTVDCSGILCYYCTVAPKPGAKLKGGQLCRHFQETMDYQVYCPNSTLCVKRSIHHRLGNGSLIMTSVERGCAPQLHVSEVYDFTARRWNTKQEVVKDAYHEGCDMDLNRGTPGGPSELCYCSYHLCNGAFVAKNFCVVTVLLICLQLWMQRSFL